MTVATSRIIGVRFGLNGTDQIIKQAPYEVKNSDIVKDNDPAPGGVYDTAMGSTELSINCSTCFKVGGKCLGHNGHIKLPVPAYQPIVFPSVIKWLKIICHECGNTHSCKGTFNECMNVMRKQATKNKNKSAVVVCTQCNTIQRKYTVDTKFKLIFNADEFDSSGQVTGKLQLMPNDVKQIFEKVSDETLERLELKEISHPRTFLIEALQVAANTTRPQNMKTFNGSKTNADDLTKMYKHIVDVTYKIVHPEKAAEDSKKSKKVGLGEKQLYIELIYNVMQLIKGPVTGDKVPDMSGSDGEPYKSIVNKIKSKQGTIRKYMLGKRAWGMCRSTITGNPRQPIPSIGFPLSFAQTIKKRETYRHYNDTRIKMLVANARIKRYPMACNIIKPDGRVYQVTNLDTGSVSLNYGDTVEYNLMDNDYVNFNRQPTLELCSISSHFLNVHKRPDELTLSMNVIACDFYNADFDGDEMNTIHAKHMHTTYEMRAISAFHNFVISSTNGSPQIGQINDSIVGLYELTRYDILLTREEAMGLFANTTFLPRFEKDTYTGRDIITLCLKPTPVNYIGKPTSYDANLEPYMDYDASEKKVVIKNGVMLSGVLDKASIGSGGHKNLYHIIERDYGPQAMLDAMFNMQQISLDFILMKGFSLGTKDILLPEGARARIRTEEANLINESKLITDRLNRGAIVPPIGKTHKEFFEDLQINALRPGDVYNEIILRNIMRRDNGLKSIIMSGSKGKLNNYMAIAARAGQMLINGSRLQDNAGYRRASAYATRFDDDPKAYGYITNSYMSGQTAMEYISNASNARFDLITKALSTSVTGDKNRNAVKNLENIFVDNMFRCMRGRNVVQLVEGEDGFSSQRIEKVKLPLVRMSGEAIRAKYEGIVEEEFISDIIRDNDISRSCLLKVAQMKISTHMNPTFRSPYDIDRIIANKIGDIKKTDKPARNYAFVKKFIDLLPRLYLNSKYTGPIHEQFKAAVTNLTTYSRCVLADYAPWLSESQLQVVFDTCCDKFYRALIDPGTAIGIQAGQCICAPMTQHMLDSHTRSATGGTTKNSMDQVQEIVNATVPEKLSSANMYLVPELSKIQDQAAVRIIANEIEMMDFRRFVKGFECFFEEYGNPVYPKYAHEADDIADFTRVSMQKRPADLINWCVRYELDKAELIPKGMSVGTIVKKLREHNENCYFMYTSDISKVVYIRQYFRPDKKEVTVDSMKKAVEDTLGQVVRGISGIQSAQVVQHQYTDPITFEDRDGWAIKTVGINLKGIVTKEGLDPTQCHTSSIIEAERFLGIIAARNKIVIELDHVASDVDVRHKLLYADEMTRIGKVVSIERPGLAVREKTDILGRAALSSPAKAFTDAAINATAQEIDGVSNALLVGSIPRVGTHYNTKILDMSFVKNTLLVVNDIRDEFE